MKSCVSAVAILLLSASFSSAYAQSQPVRPAPMPTEQPAAAQAANPADLADAADPMATPEGAEIGPSAAGKKVDPLDPVSGTVGPTSAPFYDFYERQIRYRAADKAFRESIEVRRTAFENPNATARSTASEKITKIYSEENKQAAQASQGGDELASVPVEQMAAPIPPAPVDTRPVVPMGEPGDGMEQAPQTLKEQEESLKQAENKPAPPAATPPAATPQKPAATAPVAAAPAPAVAPTPPADVTPPAPPKAPEAPKPVIPPTTTTAPTAPAPQAAPSAAPEAPVGVKEIPVEDTPELGEPEKKVVVPGDAPAFDNSPFE